MKRKSVNLSQKVAAGRGVTTKGSKRGEKQETAETNFFFLSSLSLWNLVCSWVKIYLWFFIWNFRGRSRFRSRLGVFKIEANIAVEWYKWFLIPVKIWNVTLDAYKGSEGLRAQLPALARKYHKVQYFTNSSSVSLTTLRAIYPPKISTITPRKQNKFKKANFTLKRLRNELPERCRKRARAEGSFYGPAVRGAWKSGNRKRWRRRR